jgi:hypothetical protein
MQEPSTDGENLSRPVGRSYGVPAKCQVRFRISELI